MLLKQYYYLNLFINIKCKLGCILKAFPECNLFYFQKTVKEQHLGFDSDSLVHPAMYPLSGMISGGR